MSNSEESEPESDAAAEPPAEDANGADDATETEVEPGTEATESTEEDTESDEESTTEETVIGEDDFVQLSYTIRTVEDDRLVDTTDREIAEAEEIDTEEREFGPRTFVIGGDQLFSGVEDDLVGKSVGATGTVQIPAEEAFGEFDPDDVRTISADRLPEDNRQPGAQVTVDGEQGFVETVIGGRARVDFNHPLAGEAVEYQYEIDGVVEDRLDRARELLSTYLDMELEVSIGTEQEEKPSNKENVETEVEEYETLYIEATPQLSMNQQWMFSKQQIADELIDYVEVDRVVIREVLDGGGMGPMGSMMGGPAGGGEAADIESAIEDADLEEEIDADEVVEELETGDLDE